MEDLDATVRGEGGFGSTGVKLSDNKENECSSKKRKTSDIRKDGLCSEKLELKI